MRFSNSGHATLTIALVALLGCGRGENMPGDDEIEYRGQKIKLSRSYADYDDYKDDRNNVAPTEIGRVQGLVSEAPIAKSFASREAMGRAMMEIKFPGYGLSSRHVKSDAGGATLSFYSIEIPAASKRRIITFRCANGKYDLLDDFIAPDDPMILNVREEGGQLLYMSPDDTIVFTRVPCQQG